MFADDNTNLMERDGLGRLLSHTDALGQHTNTTTRPNRVRVYDAGKIIGALDGVDTPYIRAECSQGGNTIDIQLQKEEHLMRLGQIEMEHDIDFKDGIITYENLFWLFNNTNELIYKLEFEEDLLQVQFFNEKYILDVGWYSTTGKNGKFKVYVIKNYDWENPLFTKSNKKN